MLRKILIFICLLLFLSGCSSEYCIDADDFGFVNMTVSARYSQNELQQQYDHSQIAPWKDSGYRLDGKPLNILVRSWDLDSDGNNKGSVSAWCPWYGGKSFSSSDDTDDKKEDADKQHQVLSPVCARLAECEFLNDKMDTKTVDAKIINAPCLLKKGVGLYALIAKNDPNSSIIDMQDPDGITMHLGEKYADKSNNYKMLDIDSKGNVREAGGIVYNYGSLIGTSNNAKIDSSSYYGHKLYFKILDRFYDDNSGQYRMSIRSGVINTQPDPITYITNLVINFLFGSKHTIDYGSAIKKQKTYLNNQTKSKGVSTKIVSLTQQQKTAQESKIVIDKIEQDKKSKKLNDREHGGIIGQIFQNIITHPGYKITISALLTIFVIYTALEFLTGNMQLTNAELVSRILKIAIVGVLLNAEYSWNFFYNYLFTFFIDGMHDILRIIQTAGASGPGSPSILALMIAPQTMAKLFSLLFVDWKGFIYIILFFIALYFILMIFFQAAVIYLSALIALGLIIAMGPIFITFMLFPATRSLFQNWLKQMASYAFQPVILFTGLVFISAILRHEIYGSLGFRVCKFEIPKLSEYDLGTSPFYWWFPNPMKGKDFATETATIPIPIAHVRSDGKYCEPYECFGDRYPDLPFLNPNDKNKYGKELIGDWAKIQDFHNGNFIHLKNLLLIFVAIYLLHRFNGIAVKIATFIAGTGMSSHTSAGAVGSRAFNQMLQGMQHGARRYVAQPAKKYASRALGDAGQSFKGYVGRNLEGTKVKKAYDVAKGLGQAAANSLSFDRRMFRKLKKEALDPKNANKAVLDKVRLNTGLSLSQISKNGIKDYRAALADKLQKHIPDISDDKIKNISKRGYPQLKDEFAKAMCGKTYESLSDAEKKAVDKELGGKVGKKTLREMARDANMAYRFREAYIDAHQELSHKGVGMFGKKLSSLRNLEEIKYEMQREKSSKEEKRVMRGEKLFAGYEGIKSRIFDKATGGDKPDSSQHGLIRGAKELYGGGRWHDPSAHDDRRRTYGESVEDRKQQIKAQDVARDIEQASRQVGESVIAPEYLAKMRRIGKTEVAGYDVRKLAQDNVKHEVHRRIFGDQGGMGLGLGEKYMKTIASHDELRENIDQIYTARDQMIREDEFVNREGHYRESLAIISDNIRDKYEMLSAYYDRDDITAQEMPSLLNDMYKDQLEKNVIDQDNIEDARREVRNLQNNLYEFTQNQEILQAIDIRKQQIAKEVDKKVDRINVHMKAKGDSYNPDKKKFSVRTVQTIEDALGIPETRKTKNVDHKKSKASIQRSDEKYITKGISAQRSDEKSITKGISAQRSDEKSITKGISAQRSDEKSITKGISAQRSDEKSITKGMSTQRSNKKLIKGSKKD